jgi:hypothetical protein
MYSPVGQAFGRPKEGVFDGFSCPTGLLYLSDIARKSSPTRVPRLQADFSLTVRTPNRNDEQTQ